MRGHGWYQRWFHGQAIEIYRWKCLRCHRIFALTPPWLVPRIGESAATIKAALKARRNGFTWTAVKKWPAFRLMSRINAFSTGAVASRSEMADSFAA